MKFKLLQILEFNSNRQRMSVIVKDHRGDVILYTKGADTVIIPRLSPGYNIHRECTIEYVD